MDILLVTVTQATDTITQGQVRQHLVKMDSPKEEDGTDEGAKAREIFLTSVGSCFMRNLYAAIKAREAAISELSVEVEGTMGEKPNRFVKIEMRISANYEDEVLMQKLVTISERACSLVNTLRNALEFEFVVAQNIPL
jgi:putative redox protein